MASHGADANEAANFPSTIPELLKILPKRETTLQIRMGNPAASSNANSSSNNNTLNNRHHYRNTNNNNHHSNNHRSNSNNNNHNNIHSSSSSPSVTTPNSSQQSGPCYHTLRYDFKPASINSEEPARLELTQNGQVTIKAPNVGGSISNQTVFRGQRRPHVKECLLVIDNITGEMVLQKLTDNITVKATRSLGGGGSAGGACGTRDGVGGERASVGVSGQQVATSVLQPLPPQILDRGNIGNNSGIGSSGNGHSPNLNQHHHNQHNQHHHTSTSNNLPISKNDGPQLSEDSSSSDDSSDDSSSSSSSSSSSNSGNSSPNNEGFTF